MRCIIPTKLKSIKDLKLTFEKISMFGDDWMKKYSEAINGPSVSNLETKEILTKTIKEVKSDIEIVKDFRGLKIYALAISKIDGENKLCTIKCYNEKPISQCIYNVKSDSSVFYCYKYINLGAIPCNYLIKMKSGFEYQHDIPIPEKVFQRYMAKSQIEKLKEFKLQHKDDKFVIKYLQFVKVY